MSDKLIGHKPIIDSIKSTINNGLDGAYFNKLPTKSSQYLRALVLFNSSSRDAKKRLLEIFGDEELSNKILKSTERFQFFTISQYSVLIVKPLNKARLKIKNTSEIKQVEFGCCRDSMGKVVSQWGRKGDLIVEVDGGSKEAISGLLVGLEMANYTFKSVFYGNKNTNKIYLKKIKGNFLKKQADEAVILGQSVNLARHLVNLPANLLTPGSYSEAVVKLFSTAKNVKINIWDDKTLRKNKMGLILAVGAGSPNPPRLVHIKYRPVGVKNKQPVAFVGKGITFDTGGANLKPAAGMRKMKKDMGGSASLFGLAYYLINAKVKQNCDIYLALAENSIDGKNFSPGDIINSASGTTVEIDNTDAEGRLVLADTLHVASTAKGADKPRALIDVATLTGAMKVGLGTDISGYFANDDKLAARIEKSSERSAEPTWRMPLYPEYLSMMKSTVADLVNSSTTGYGGAMTAALFLQEFVGDIPWAHFDIYAWNDSASGACLEAGGSGQMVQSLVEFISN